MTETITDTDEIATLAIQILAEHGDLTTDQLLAEFRIHDTDVAPTRLWDACSEDDRIHRIDDRAWRHHSQSQRDGGNRSPW